MHIGESALDAIVVEAESLVIETREMQRSCVGVVAVGGVLGCFEAEVVSIAVGSATFDTPARHAGGEGTGVVIVATRTIDRDTHRGRDDLSNHDGVFTVYTDQCWSRLSTADAHAASARKPACEEVIYSR